MRTYTWANEESPIQKIQAIPRSDGWELVLYPQESAENGSLSSLPEEIARQGWFPVIDINDHNKPILRVYGVQEPENAIQFLRDQGVIDAEKQPKLEDDGAGLEKKSDNMKNSATIFAIGDVLQWLAGLVEGNKKLQGGALYALFASAITVYGRSINTDLPLGRFVKDAQQYMKKQGIDLSEYKDPEAMAKVEGVVPAFNQFLSDYSVETTMLFNGLSSYNNMRGGMGGEGTAGDRHKGLTFGGGLSITTVSYGLVTRLLMENKHNMSQDGVLRQATDFMEKTALPFRGIGCLVGNVGIIIDDSIKAFRLRKEVGVGRAFFSAVLRAASNVVYAIGNVPYAMGSLKKDQPFEMEEATASMSNVMLALPKEKRVKAVKEAAHYFAAHDPENRDVEFHKGEMNKKLNALEASPFLAPAGPERRLRPPSAGEGLSA